MASHLCAHGVQPDAAVVAGGEEVGVALGVVLRRRGGERAERQRPHARRVLELAAVEPR